MDYNNRQDQFEMDNNNCEDQLKFDYNWEDN